MTENEKDERIRYLEAIIDDIMKANGIHDFKDVTLSRYCQFCYEKLTDEKPKSKSPIKALMNGVVYGIVILIFLCMMALVFGILTH